VTASCYQCRKPTSTPVPIGIIAQDAGTGGTVHACRTCVSRHHIVPMADWKYPGDGRPQYYPAPPTR
jgi:hypothetical protein